jgi:DNA-binding transcriptional regulator YiaG
MNSSEIIKHIRSQSGLTRRQLANAVGVTYQAVRNWEEGVNCPSTDALISVCNATGFELVVKEKYSTEYNRKRRRYK